MKILLAEDDPTQRLLLESRLKKWGYEVVIAADGEEAWRLLQQPEAPKLAVLDWLMPGMDGVEVCQRVRQREDAAYVFIILLTSRDRKEDVVAGMDAGADDYLTKPFHPHELQVRLRAGKRILDLEAALRASLEEVTRRDEELDQARKREVEIGAKIQQTLLLGQPPTGLTTGRLAALSIASQQIDGDFYDFFKHTNHRLDVVVGDVMGKGIPAALLGAAIKSHFLRALSYLVCTSNGGQLPEPEVLVSMVHKEVTHQFIGLERFITLIYARFDLERCRLDFVDCGHTATIHYQNKKGQCSRLQGDNMPIGFSEHEVYQQVSVPFEVGDLFVFYSDGVTEAMNNEGEQFGLDRLENLVCRSSSLDPEDLIEVVRKAVVAHSRSDSFADDLTCVAFKVEKVMPLAHASLEVTSNLSELPRVRKFVTEFYERTGALDEERLCQLELAVSEAVANIMRHAYGGRKDGQIQAEVAAYPDRVTVQFYHCGASFDPTAVSPPAFDGTKESGFGMYFIAQSVDEVVYSQDEQGRNSILMVKRVKGDDKNGNVAGEDR